MAKLGRRAIPWETFEGASPWSHLLKWKGTGYLFQGTGDETPGGLAMLAKYSTTELFTGL